MASSLKTDAPPDMWTWKAELCLLVVKNGNATGTTIAARTASSHRSRTTLTHVRQQTSWRGGYQFTDSKSEVFSKRGDSGAIIADIVAVSVACYRRFW